MAIWKSFSLVSILIAFFLLAGCSVSTEELAAEVQASIEETLKGEGITVKDFALVHRGGNEYRGLLETKERYGEFKYSVDVVFDGRNFSWEIVDR